jgi:glycosyltransferase involved in cell wall biosynthesis
MFRRRFGNLIVPEDRGPLRVMFVHTEVVVGGAETLMMEIIRKIDRSRFHPELCCLKRLAPLGEVLADEVPTSVGLLKNKYDLRVLGRLTRLLRQRRIDAVVTVGTGGDRMFWGRLAAWRARVPVILSALHATGYPMRVERLNRMLAPVTDGFIGCAKSHSEFLVEGEGCPRNKVFTVWNGVDVDRFRPRDKIAMRARRGIDPDAPVVGIVAALRPEKQHVMLVESMAKVVSQVPGAILVIVGDGTERDAIEAKTRELGLESNVRMLGMRHDVPEILSTMDVKVLSSKMEANPASTLEASACGLPVVAPNVGSLSETVLDGRTGILCTPDDPLALADAMVRLLSDPERAREMGEAGRDLVCQRFSVEAMVRGYERLIDGVYRAALGGGHLAPEEFDRTMETELQRIAAEQTASNRQHATSR